MIKEFKENGLEFIKVSNNAGLEVTLCSLGAGIFSIDFYLWLSYYECAVNNKIWLSEEIQGKATAR